MARALISAWVIVQILLMIRFRIPPLARRQNFRNNLPLPPFLISQLSDLPRHTLLLLVVIKNPAAVLRAGIWALAVRGRRIVHLVEELEELAVSYLRGVVGNLQGFGICF